MSQLPSPSPDPKSRSPLLSNPERWVEEYGDYLFRYALGRLRDPLRAEDAVQETFLAALKGLENFHGRSAEKSWLVGILKNKIFDYFRKAGRETPFADLQFYEDEEQGTFEREGLTTGAWVADAGPQEWRDAGASLDNEVFWQTYRDCTSRLPRNVATAFNLREVDGIATPEICSLLNITENNLWVMLHRARLALRRCLELNWFAKNRQPE